MQIVMETDLPSGQCVTQDQMATVRQIVEHRLPYLHIAGAEVQLQSQGCSGRVTVNLRSAGNPSLIADPLKSAGQLEFVEISPSDDSPFPKVQQGVYIRPTSNDSMPDAAALRNGLSVEPILLSPQHRQVPRYLHGDVARQYGRLAEFRLEHLFGSNDVQ